MEFSKEQMKFIEEVYYLGYSRSIGSFKKAFNSLIKRIDSESLDFEILERLKVWINNKYPDVNGMKQNRSTAINCAILLGSINTGLFIKEIAAFFGMFDGPQRVYRAKKQLNFGDKYAISVFYELVTVIEVDGFKAIKDF